MEENIDEKIEKVEPVSESNSQSISGIPSKKDTLKFFSKIPRHNWAIATYVFAIIAILLVIATLSNGQLTGKVISEKNIQDKIEIFINVELLADGGAVIESIEKQSGVYTTMVNLEGDIIPLYFTLDGNFITQGRELIPIAGETAPVTGNTVAETQELPKSDKPKVEAFIMSHCPYGTQFEKGIIPIIETLGDKIDWEIKFVYYAMHGEVEVTEQLNQYCIQKEQKEKYIDYLKCFLNEGDGETCLTQTNIDQTKLTACTVATDEEFEITKNLEDEDSWLSGRFPKFNIHLDENEAYDVKGSPALIINGETASSSRDPASLLKTVCSSFNNAPEECEIELSSETPSAGFGYDTTTGGSTGSCG
ncbi:MAG: hypothetical protein U9Q06_02030 [Nanoarchaeota archaeon]|nr:hypothetical protein [Nanoarchaeota archaeon]